MAMADDEFRSVINRLGWSYEIAADRAGRSYSRFRKIASGRDPVDPALERWLRALVAILDTPPAPLPRNLPEDEIAAPPL
jgi:hypothetical protein